MPPSQPFRGVSLGGWLVFESFITERFKIHVILVCRTDLRIPPHLRPLQSQPYLFTLTDCDVRGEFYDMRIGDRTKHTNSVAAEGINRNVVKIGNETKECTPLDQYPVDTWTLASSFASKEIARKYLTRHWESWVTEETIAKIASAGLTHVKIPIGHWILGDIRDGEPWVDGEWKYFRRAVSWCRKYGLQVIADIHTAPGSQNGFDNSGQLLSQKTARHWLSHPDRIARSVKAVGDVARTVKDEALDDVVTGVEILNEIYSDANITTVKQFYEESFEAVREYLPYATVVASDNFDAGQFNGFWTDSNKYKDTLLDTHLYTVFSEKLRAMSPKQHVAFICGNHYNIELMKCCWDDDGRSQGLGRIIGEWTASYDTLVGAEINVVFDEIANTGLAPKFDRKITPNEMSMLRNYVEAQMVVYEGRESGDTSGWFYWNFAMEGGVFAEWDFLRGIDEGWIPQVRREILAEDRFGSCETIIERTKDDYSVVHEFPDPKDLPPDLVEDRYFDDDVVMTHGQSLERDYRSQQIRYGIILVGIVMIFLTITRKWKRDSAQYRPLPDVGVEAIKPAPSL
eukprot:CAMPEP_0178730436 /NCGR_PEP_ID=MMETSP0699-20121125/29516_1 /TAXON_ID=265572 /ORGANISM="Extubocellulus spinifer, Strain CCMP396" /LENGTH=569 /DNA_ID=CAMNT_0020382457 /DNA_START=305 /DNA_END=2014 /DNA_ORIENTATION=+